MYSIYHNIFYRPPLNILGFITLVVPGQSFGGAIILFAIVINSILLPITHRMKQSQKKIQELQPELDALKQQFKNKRDELTRRQLELYKKHDVSPFSVMLGFFFALLQIPLFLALFQIFRKNGDFYGGNLYSFMPRLGQPNNIFLGFIDLAAPSIILAAAAALSQFIQLSRMPSPKSQNPKDVSFASVMQKNMRYTLPGIIFITGLSFPAALTLYWTTMSLFGIVHEEVMRKKALSLADTNGNGTCEKQ